MIYIRNQFITARALLKRMGVNAGVDIEPDTQTALADATQSLPGVLCAGVPGAGGMDAIFALLIGDSSRELVERLWSRWGSEEKDGVTVCPLMLKEDISSGARTEPDILWD